MFSYTTGRSLGLEDMVTTSGPGMTLIYLLVLPFFWCIPVSLVAAELTTAMPVEGGFYRWTRAAFGDFWDFSRAGGTGRHRSYWAELMRFCLPTTCFPGLRDGSTTWFPWP